MRGKFLSYQGAGKASVRSVIGSNLVSASAFWQRQSATKRRDLIILRNRNEERFFFGNQIRRRIRNFLGKTNFLFYTVLLVRCHKVIFGVV